MTQNKTYLALGDSYTIGEAVEQSQSFPYQLQKQLINTGIDIDEPTIIAKTGWTTDELQQAINEADIKQTFDIVTLLIGVNNQYRGYPEDTYRKEFIELLHGAIGFARGNKNHVFVVSIPDWGVTEFAKQQNRDEAKVAQEINAFNLINKEETLKLGSVYIDITQNSRKAKTDYSLIAEDGLHPSGKMYYDWSNALYEKIAEVFK